MCPGHILLFGLVNILFSSLLSKSLTIKGREARPGRERGRAENMPRISTRASQASGSSGAPLVLSGDEDGVAPPPRIPPEEKERLRQMQKACTLRMYDHAVAYFMRTLQRTKTEGVGDCWLLSIMGGFEVKDPKLVKEVNDAQRRTICTARRLASHRPWCSLSPTSSRPPRRAYLSLESDLWESNTHRRGDGIHGPSCRRPPLPQTVARRRLFLPQQ